MLYVYNYRVGVHTTYYNCVWSTVNAAETLAVCEAVHLKRLLAILSLSPRVARIVATLFCQLALVGLSSPSFRSFVVLFIRGCAVCVHASDDDPTFDVERAFLFSIVHTYIYIHRLPLRTPFASIAKTNERRCSVSSIFT